MIDPLRFAPVLLLTFLGSLVVVPAQQPADQKKPGPKKFDPTKLEKEDKEVASRCAGILMRFGDFCKAQKVAPRAKESYDRILNLYDPEHLGARQALGFKKTKEGWQEAKPALKEISGPTASKVSRKPTAPAASDRTRAPRSARSRGREFSASVASRVPRANCKSGCWL